MVEATPEMCFYCFDSLIEYFNKSNNVLYKRRKSPSLSLIPNHECSLFVSWKKHQENGEELRGCKGTHSLVPLHEALKYYSIISASEDKRFESVTEDELPYLCCTVSLIYGFENISDCYDWNVGEHGLKIDFVDSKNRERSATFLPEVAVDFGWTKKIYFKTFDSKSWFYRYSHF